MRIVLDVCYIRLFCLVHDLVSFWNRETLIKKTLWSLTYAWGRALVAYSRPWSHIDASPETWSGWGPSTVDMACFSSIRSAGPSRMKSCRRRSMLADGFFYFLASQSDSGCVFPRRYALLLSDVDDSPRLLSFKRAPTVLPFVPVTLAEKRAICFDAVASPLLERLSGPCRRLLWIRCRWGFSDYTYNLRRGCEIAYELYRPTL